MNRPSFRNFVTVQALIVQSLNIAIGDADLAFDIGAGQMDVGRAAIFGRCENIFVRFVMSLKRRIVRLADIGEGVVRDSYVCGDALLLTPAVQPVSQFLMRGHVAGQASNDLRPR